MDFNLAALPEAMQALTPPPQPRRSILGQRVAPVFYHGTSSTFLPDIEGQGLRNPHLCDSLDKAEYYANEACAEFGGEAMIFEVEVFNQSNLRHDYCAMEEPVLASDVTRNQAWNKAAKQHPEWVKKTGKSVIIDCPPEAWQVSWEGVGSVKYNGVIPFQNLHDESP